MRPGAPDDDGDAVAEIDRLLDVVGDEDEARSGLVAHPLQFVLQRGLGHGIERGERLVHQQHLGAQRQRARDLHALLHAAGQLPGIIVGVAVEPNETERVAHPLLDLAARQSAFQPEGDIARDRAPLQQRVRIVLEDDHHIGGRAVDGAAVHGDGAAGGGRQTAEDAQQGGLAGAGGTDHGEKLAAAQLERDVVENAPLAVLVRELDADTAAGEDKVGVGGDARACARRAARRAHGAVTTIAALSIGVESCPRSLSTSIQTASSSGVMVKR